MVHSLNGSSGVDLDLIAAGSGAQGLDSQFRRVSISLRPVSIRSLAVTEIPILGIILLVTAISVLVAPDFTTRSTGVQVPSLFCPFFEVLNFPCLFCGLTRSFMSMGGLDIRRAFIFHPLGPVFYLAMLGAGALMAWSIVRRQRVRLSMGAGLRNILISAGAGIIMVAWVVKVVVWYQVGLL